MGFFSFLKSLLSKPLPTPNDYVPSFWEDNYCEIEIVPVENSEFIRKQVGEIEAFSAKAWNGAGFTDVFALGDLPTPTISKEIRIDYLETTLLNLKFIRANYIRFDAEQMLDCKTGNTKAFGFPEFTIFFNTEDEFVKNIWIDIHLIVSVSQFDIIKAALYALGEECELVLVDWNRPELFDLSDKRQIEKYLKGYWK